MDGDNDVVLARLKFLIYIFLFLNLFYCRVSGSDPLVLALNVAFLSFLWLREEFVYVFNIYEGP